MVAANLVCLFVCLTLHLICYSKAGNCRFRHIISQSVDEYTQATSKWAKSMVAARIVGVITAEGGRFLKQKRDGDGEWYELSEQEAKAKVSHAIRDAIAAKDKTKASRSAGTTSKSTPPNTAKRKRPDPPSKASPKKPPPSKVPPVASASDRMLSQPSPQSLTSMAGPVFALGGPQRAVGGVNVVQDQIQHLRPPGVPFPGGTTPPLQPFTRNIPPHLPLQAQRQGQSAALRAGRRERIPGDPPAQEEAKRHTRSSDNEDSDHDHEFLSLIDSVLGPVQSPKRKKGRD